MSNALNHPSSIDRQHAMQTLRIYDKQPPGVVVDPRAVFAMLGERATQASWRVSGVTSYNEPVMIVGGESADRIEALSHLQSRISGGLLSELFQQITQVIWGEFTGYRAEEAPWVSIRAIDSSWCEVETDDDAVLDCVGRTFTQVEAGPR